MAGLKELGPGKSPPQTWHYGEGGFRVGKMDLRGRGGYLRGVRFESIREPRIFRLVLGRK